MSSMRMAVDDRVDRSSLCLRFWLPLSLLYAVFTIVATGCRAISLLLLVFSTRLTEFSYRQLVIIMYHKP